MTVGRKQRLLRQTLLLGALLAAIGYVAADAVRGPHGLIANQILRAKIGALEKDLSALRAQRIRLERDAELLKSKAESQPALLDEQARALLDLARPTDIVIVNGEKNPR
jgi:cell division protein FtsB